MIVRLLLRKNMDTKHPPADATVHNQQPLPKTLGWVEPEDVPASVMLPLPIPAHVIPTVALYLEGVLVLAAIVSEYGRDVLYVEEYPLEDDTVIWTGRPCPHKSAAYRDTLLFRWRGPATQGEIRVELCRGFHEIGRYAHIYKLYSHDQEPDLGEGMPDWGGTTTATLDSIADHFRGLLQLRAEGLRDAASGTVANAKQSNLVERTSAAIANEYTRIAHYAEARRHLFDWEGRVGAAPPPPKPIVYKTASGSKRKSTSGGDDGVP